MDPVPVDAAVMLEQLEQRVALRQVLLHRRRAPDRQPRTMFAQHIKAGGVVDLRIDQQDGCDAGVAQRAARLQRGKTADLLEDIGRCIEQRPRRIVASADRNG